jgi:hypothetical protein
MDIKKYHPVSHKPTIIESLYRFKNSVFTWHKILFGSAGSTIHWSWTNIENGDPHTAVKRITGTCLDPVRHKHLANDRNKIRISAKRLKTKNLPEVSCCWFATLYFVVPKQGKKRSEYVLVKNFPD